MPRSHIDFYLFCRGLGYFGMPHIQLRFMAIESGDKIALSRRVATVWVVISMAVAVLIDLVGNAMTHSSVITSLSGNASETVIVRMDFRCALTLWHSGGSDCGRGALRYSRFDDVDL